MIRGVIFDVDGVLLNSMPVWENLGELYLKRIGIEAEKNLGEILFTMSLEQGARYLIERYGIRADVGEVVKGLSREAEDFYQNKVPLKAGVRTYLNEFRARKIPMVIATSGDKKNAKAALRRLGIFSYFQAMLTCTEVGVGKDHPDIYYAAALQMDTEPCDTWVFEDAWHAILTAKNAGFKTAGIYDKANEKNLTQIREKADIYLPEFTDFELFWKRANA